MSAGAQEAAVSGEAAAVGRWDRLDRRVWVRARLVAQTALHVGAGDQGTDPTAVDDTVIRDLDGQPLIPGSSLKGAVRAFLERVADAGWLRGEVPRECWHALQATGRQRDWDDRVAHMEPRHRPEGIYRALCPACRLLGAPHYAGRLLVRDLPLAGPTAHEGTGEGPRVGLRRPVPLEERTGVGIHRDTGTAAKGVLYDYQAVPAGTAFALEWLLENPTEDDWYNALVVLVALRRGDIPLGGKVSRGLGLAGLEGVRIWDLRRADGSLRRYVLGRELEDLPSQGLDEAAAAAGLPGVSVRRLPAAQLQSLFAGTETLSWGEAVRRLAVGFAGGEPDVGRAAQ